MKAMICERCGAPIHGSRCEYCGTEYDGLEKPETEIVMYGLDLSSWEELNKRIRRAQEARAGLFSKGGTE